MQSDDQRLTSNSELSAHGECRFRWLMQYHLELRRPPNPSSAAEIGSDIHACVAWALEGGDWRDAHDAITASRGLIPDDADIARAMIGWEAAAGELYKDVSVIAVEVRLVHELYGLLETSDTGLNHIDGVAGVLDVVAVDRQGRRVVIDHKSTRTTVAQWASAWGMQAHSQLRFYDWLASRAIGETGGPSIAAIHHIDAKRGETDETKYTITPKARSVLGLALLVRIKELDRDISRANGASVEDLDDAWFGSLMSTGRHCQGCDYRDLCSKRLRGEPGIGQVAEEQLVRIGRLDHHQK